ncbi:AAA domain, dynein subfamily protein (macronuclear) [Tetrahymena thermophila SB210]|uniref:AAA domain, dynein subfamily protein n=1 Tax=Tetrahymena thermophila (strain SB210) TaxID=312017 RepID=Q22SD4_TETTS|nr:AAA domain, dynein subfamily protein [Tetrahymena thermophila SB210]EAR87838.2 AAA domain, dynein subfamily protein [Tetrahymena thermophila SB210]|eukprot:XP_001008083.2 AAA domain, dynein subfamily protein [Tetrahymena thermophila SB210]
MKTQKQSREIEVNFYLHFTDLSKFEQVFLLINGQSIKLEDLGCDIDFQVVTLDMEAAESKIQYQYEIKHKKSTYLSDYISRQLTQYKIIENENEKIYIFDRPSKFKMNRIQNKKISQKEDEVGLEEEQEQEIINQKDIEKSYYQFLKQVKEKSENISTVVKGLRKFIVVSQFKNKHQLFKDIDDNILKLINPQKDEVNQLNQLIEALSQNAKTNNSYNIYCKIKQAPLDYFKNEYLIQFVQSLQNNFNPLEILKELIENNGLLEKSQLQQNFITKLNQLNSEQFKKHQSEIEQQFDILRKNNKQEAIKLRQSFIFKILRQINSLKDQLNHLLVNQVDIKGLFQNDDFLQIQQYIQEILLGELLQKYPLQKKDFFDHFISKIKDFQSYYDSDFQIIKSYFRDQNFTELQPINQIDLIIFMIQHQQKLEIDIQKLIKSKSLIKNLKKFDQIVCLSKYFSQHDPTQSQQNYLLSTFQEFIKTLEAKQIEFVWDYQKELVDLLKFQQNQQKIYLQQQIENTISQKNNMQKMIDEQDQTDTLRNNQKDFPQINFEKINDIEINTFQEQSYQILVEYFHQNLKMIIQAIYEEQNVENLNKILNTIQQIFNKQICMKRLTEFYSFYKKCLEQKKIQNKEQESILVKIQQFFEQEAINLYEQQQPPEQRFQSEQYLDFLKISDKRPDFPFRKRLLADLNKFVLHHDEIKIPSIKKIIENQQFKDIYKFFQSEIKIQFSDFSKQIDQEISQFYKEKEKINKLLKYFPSYLKKENQLFEQKFKMDAQFGEIRQIIIKFKQMKSLYDYFDLLQSSKIFQKIVFMLQQQEGEYKILSGNLNNILYYSKMELINLIQMVKGNKIVSLKCLDTFQIKLQEDINNLNQQQPCFDHEFELEENEEEENSQKSISEKSILFPKKILNLQNLIQISGDSFIESEENFLNLYELLQIKEENLSETLQKFFHINFLHQYGKCLIEIAKQNDINLESQLNKQFYLDLQNLTNIDVNKKSIDYFQNSQFKCLLSFPSGFYLGVERQDNAVLTISQLDSIIKYIIDNLQNQSFLELRDLVGGDENTDLQSLLIKLNNQRKIFGILTELRETYSNNQKASFIKFIQKIVEFCRLELVDEAIHAELQQCSEDFFKIKQIDKSQQNQQDYISLAIEVLEVGEFQFYLDEHKDNPEQVKLVVLSNQEYSELDIRKICSKVIIDQNMVKIHAQFIKEREKKNKPKSKISSKSMIQVEEEESEECKQIKNSMKMFKDQWEAAERLKEVISNLISFGKFDILQRKLIFSNKNQTPQKNLEQMEQNYQTYTKELTEWKNQLCELFQQYPYFSLIGFSYYQELITYCEEGKYEDFSKVNPGLINILKFMSLSLQDIQEIPFSIKLKKNQSYFSKLQSIANNCTQKCKQFDHQMIEKSYEDKIFEPLRFKDKLVKYIFSGSQELIEILIGGVQNQDDNYGDFYKYLFCDKSTKFTDLQLFMFRFKNLISNNKQNTYYLIINTKLEVKFFNQVNDILSDYNKQSNTIKNQLIVLIREGLDQKQISCLPQEKKINKQTIASILYQNAIIYYSNSSGCGKSFEIQKKISEQNQNSFRIPIGGSNKNQILQTLKQKLNKVEPGNLHIHLDVCETSEYDLNLLFFELIVLKSISIHSDQLVYFEKFNQTTFYIEIANTLDEGLYQSIHIKNFFERQKVEFDASRFQLESPNKSKEEIINYKAAFQSLYYIYVLETTGVNHFNKEQTDDSYNLDNAILSNINNLIKNKIVEQITVPCFYQIVRFLNLFGSEMRKMNKSYFLSPEYIKSEGLDHQLRTIIVSTSYKLCSNICFTQYEQKNIIQNQQVSKEMQLNQKSENIKEFSNFEMDFITFQEQESPCLTMFFRNSNQVPRQIKELVELNKEKLLYFNENLQPEDLLRWLVKLIKKDEQKIYSDRNNNSFDSMINDDISKFAKRIIIQKDNFFKIAMIFMRIRANSPVIIMGQSGIGKSILIEVMSVIMEAQFKIMIVHAGITEQDVTKLIEESIEISQKNNQKVVVFFDEVNTNKLVSSLFKEIIVDRHIYGEPIPSNVIPIAAINPYKLKSEQQKKMIDIQIHGGIKKEMVKKIKNTDLEYSVEPIPESMYSFIWNFDKLQLEDEKKYISQILQTKYNEKKKKQIYKIFADEELDLISKGIFESQIFLREKMGYQSACSLRDVSRFTKLLFWFIKFLTKCRQFELKILDKDFQSTCLYLSFYINYCVRLPLINQRKQYLYKLSEIFQENRLQIWKKIDDVSTYLINQTEVPRGIVKNTALKQNVFTLFVSIMNKIPVVLIGPPGCSKTLSLRIIIKSMKGKQSKSPLFQKLKTLMPLLYQGHVQSTSEKILEVFERAKNKVEQYKKQNEQKNYISMVHLEEIGLAEISPHNPLKVLHQTLEKPEIAIACISNWPLDQSKMNRMLAIYRLDVDEDELVEILKSTQEYVHSFKKDQSVQNVLKQDKISDQLQVQIAKTYQSYLEQVKKEMPEYEQFHGLRDFYGMAKLLISKKIQLVKDILKQSNDQLIQIQISDSLIMQNNQALIAYSFIRHFSGLETHDILFNTLKKQFKDQELNEIQKLKQIQLIQDNLTEVSDDFMSRHLMIISRNSQATLEFINSELISLQKPYQIFMGSDFQTDQKSQNTYKIINEIIDCVEKGKIVVLKNLDNIYQSLYDLLNQNYKYFNGKYYCSISFNADSREIPVSPDFKIILIADQSQIHKMDGPLLNRFEKHTFSESMIISQKDQNKINRIYQYFIDLKQNIFNFNNIKELVQSLVLQQSKLQGSSEEDYVKQQIYHLTSFSYAIQMINAQDEEFKKTYIESNYHYSLDSFIENRIFKSDNENKKLFCIYSPQQDINSTSKYNLNKIQISQIDSQQVLVNQLKQFFENLVIKSQAQLQDEDANMEPIEEEINQKILMVICDQYVDSFERISFVRQKIVETMISYQNRSNLPFSIILCIRTTDIFQALPYFANCEQYFIEDLYLNSNLDRVLSLSQIIYRLDENLNSVVDFDQLQKIFMSKKELISNSFGLVSYGNIVQEDFLLNRLKDIFTIFSFKDEEKISVISFKFIQAQIKIFLEQNQLVIVRDFVYKQIIEKGKAQQRISLLSAIKEGIMEIIQIGVAKFIAVLENNYLIYSIIHSANNSSLKKIVAQNLIDILNIGQVDFTDKEAFYRQINESNQTFDLTVNIQPKEFKFPGSQKYISILQNCIKELDFNKNENNQEKLKNIQIEENDDIELENDDQVQLNQSLDTQYNNFLEQIQNEEQINLIQFTILFIEDYINHGIQGIDLTHLNISLQIIEILQKQTQNYSSFEIEQEQEEEEKQNLKLNIQAMMILNIFKEDILRIDEIMAQFSWILRKEEIMKRLKFNHDAPNQSCIIQYAQALVQLLIQLMKPSEELQNKMKSQDITYKDQVQELVRFIDFYELYKSDQIKNSQQKLYLQQLFINNIMEKLQIDWQNKVFDELQDIIQYNLKGLDNFKNTVKRIYFNQQDDDYNQNTSKSSKVSIIKKRISKLKKNKKIDADQENEDTDKIDVEDNIKNNEEENNNLDEKIKQFEIEWIYFVLDILQNQINQNKFKDILGVVVNQLVQIEENLDNLKVNPLPKDIVIRFNIILNILFSRITKLDDLISLFNQEEHKPLLNQNYPKQTEHTVFVIITDIIQINCLHQLINQDKEKEKFYQFVFNICEIDSLAKLSLFQKLIFFSIYRELTLILCLNKDKISFDNKCRIQKFYNQIDIESLQLYVVKQIYNQYGNEITSFIKQSEIFSNIKWLKELSSGFVGILDSSFLTEPESKLYKNYFQNNQNLKSQLIKFFKDEISKSNNIFKSLLEGIIHNELYYPFSKLNNISLFRYDIQNNSQLYQCLNCQEYIFSNQCSNLKSNFMCQRCGHQIAKGSPNTKLVLQDAHTQKTELQNIINQNQWKGIYIRLIQGINDDQLEQGNSLDLRIFTLMYSISIILAFQRKRLSSQKQVTMTSFKNKQLINEQVSIWELCEHLKIHYQENPENFLNEQIDLAIEQIYQIMKFKDIREQEISIILFKIINVILNDDSIKPLQDPEERSKLNSQFSLKIQDIILQSKLVLLNQQKGEIHIVKILETFQFENIEQKVQNYYRNLRFVKVSSEPNFIQRQIQQENQNNKDYQSMKKILDSNEIEYISKSLKVLVSFTQLMQKYLSNSFTMKSAQNKTLVMVLQDEETHPLLKCFQQQLIPIWKEIKEKEKEFIIGCRDYKIYDLDEETKLNDLVYSSNTEDGIFSNIFEILCLKQNNIIQEFQSLVDSVSRTQKNMVIKVKTIQHLDENLNILKPYKETIFRKYFMNSPEYKEGNTYIFDLKQIQEELVKTCLTGTVFIDLQNSEKFSFLQEISILDFGHLSNIKIKQEPISQEVKQNLQDILQNKEQMYDLLNKLIRAFQFYLNSSDKEEMPLMQAFDNVKIRIKIPKLSAIMSESIKLKHLSSMICTLEEFNIDNLVNLCDPSFKCQIGSEKFEKAYNFISSNNLELNNFLIALGRFIFRYLSKEGLCRTENLFGQIFRIDIYKEIWNDSSQIESLLNEAVKLDILIKESFYLYQKLKQRRNQKRYNLESSIEMDIESNQNLYETMYLENFSDDFFNKKIIDS